MEALLGSAADEQLEGGRGVQGTSTAGGVL